MQKLTSSKASKNGKSGCLYWIRLVIKFHMRFHRQRSRLLCVPSVTCAWISAERRADSIGLLFGSVPCLKISGCCASSFSRNRFARCRVCFTSGTRVVAAPINAFRAGFRAFKKTWGGYLLTTVNNPHQLRLGAFQSAPVGVCDALEEGLYVLHVAD